MTDLKPEDLVPVTDDQATFDLRMALKPTHKGRRGKVPIAESEAAETVTARRLLDTLKRSGLLFYRRRLAGPPPTGVQMGTGPGTFVKPRGD